MAILPLPGSDQHLDGASSFIMCVLAWHTEMTKGKKAFVAKTHTRKLEVWQWVSKQIACARNGRGKK